MANTAIQMIPAVGKQINVHVETWVIPMTVTDVKNSWGRVRLEVEPLNGSGRQWIELTRVQRVNVERAVVAYA
uniref:Uncharacterized protein n=1 Tax=viral metagenome TaxID=1070528 RepID=A0A6H1Z6Y8_9ZZZZ